MLRLQNNQIISIPIDFGPAMGSLQVLLLWVAFGKQQILHDPYFSGFHQLREIYIGYSRIKEFNASYLPSN